MLYESFLHMHGMKSFQLIAINNQAEKEENGGKIKNVITMTN